MPVSGEVGSRFAAPVAELIQAEELKLLESAALALRGDQTRADWEATSLARIRLWRTQADKLVAGAAAKLAVAVREALLGAQKEGAAVALADIPGRTVDPPDGERGLRLSQDRLGAQLAATLQQTPRLLEAVLREAVRAGVDEVRAGRVTRPQASQQVFNRLALQGITGFRDKAGRNWSLSSYCEMAVRTETQARALAAGDATIKELGLTQVVVSDSPRECDICRPFEGQVLTLAEGSREDPVVALVSPDVLRKALSPTQHLPNMREARELGLSEDDDWDAFLAYSSHPDNQADPRERIEYYRAKIRAGEKVNPIKVNPPFGGRGKANTMDGHHRAAAFLEENQPAPIQQTDGKNPSFIDKYVEDGMPKALMTLADARAKGFQHPNCTHSYSAYIPGVTKLDKPKANPDGYEQKQRQREMERKVREWKRREALALDPAAKAAARDKVKGWQGQLRKHVAAHDLKRQSGREQLQTVR